VVPEGMNKNVPPKTFFLFSPGVEVRVVGSAIARVFARVLRTVMMNII